MKNYFNNIVALLALLAQTSRNPLIEQVSGLSRFGITLAQLSLSKKVCATCAKLVPLKNSMKAFLLTSCATNATNAPNNFTT